MAKFFYGLGYVFGAAVVVALLLTIPALLLWLLVPLAFPALVFGFWNAVALSAILWLFSAPAILNN